MKGQTLYAFFMGWPDSREVVIAPLAKNSKYSAGKIESVELIGFKVKVEWRQGEAGLNVQLPVSRPCDHAFALKISGAGTV